MESLDQSSQYNATEMTREVHPASGGDQFFNSLSDSARSLPPDIEFEPASLLSLSQAGMQEATQAPET